MSFDKSIPYTISAQGTTLTKNSYLTVIQNFLVVDCSMTQIDYKTQDTSDNYLVVEHDSLYYHFATYTLTGQDYSGGIVFFISKSYDSGQDFYNQPSSPSKEWYTIPVVSDVPQYYLYFNGKNIYFVTEFNVGYYHHISMGKATSIGTFDNYYMASNTYFKLDDDGDISNQFKAFMTYSANNDNRGDTVFIDNIEEVAGDLINNCYASSIQDYPVFFRDFIENSRTKINDKGILFTPMHFRDSGGFEIIPLIEHSDFYASAMEYCNDLEEFEIGLKKYKYFSNGNKLVTPNFNLATQRGQGIVLRIE